MQSLAGRIHSLFLVGAAGGEHERWSYLACKLMRCRLKEDGEAAYRMKQCDFERLILRGVPRGADEPDPEVDWKRELTPDERGE